MNLLAKQTLAAFAAAAFWLFLFWLGGYDFDRRGEPAVSCFLLAGIFGGLAFLAVGDLCKPDKES